MIIQMSPCPFCCSDNVELETTTDGGGVVECAHVECVACLARGPEESTQERAIGAWNARGLR